MALEDREVRERVARIEGLLEEIESLAEPEARSIATETVRRLVELYGEGLSRILERGARPGPSGLAADLAADELVSHLLLLHGLHPVAVEKRVAGALEEVRPYLRSHGGDVELLRVEEGVAYLRLVGGCSGCRSSSSTLRHAIEKAIGETAPDVDRIEAEGVVAEGVVEPRPVPLTMRGRRGAGAGALPGRAGGGGAEAEVAGERCELCGEPVARAHRHLLDTAKRELRCACQGCAALFDRKAAGGGHYRLVPDRFLSIADLRLDDAVWQSLRIPVALAFFLRSTPPGRVAAFYPSPMGATESLLDLEHWAALEAANPVLGEMEPDVEALLVNRAREAREYWIVPVDACYRLVGLVRTTWKGLSGGEEAWAAIDRFFEELRRRSPAVGREGGARRA